MTTTQVKKPPVESKKASFPEKDGVLKEAFRHWDQAQLIEYAVSTTQALLDEQEVVKNLTKRYDSTQSWALGLALVEEIGQNLSSTLNLKEVLTRLLSRVYNAINVEDGSILLIEEPSGDLATQVVLGSLSKSSKPFRVPKGHGIAGEVAATGVPIIVNNAKDDTRHFTQIDQDTGFQTKSILCVPLFNHQKIIGVLEVFNKKNGSFTQHDQLLLTSIANYAGIAIENAQLHESVVEERNLVIRAQEEVSHKLQRDLHDGPTQLVAALQMNIDFCRQALKHNRVKLAETELENMLELAQRASHQMRTLLFELRPLVLETKGLIAALSMYLERRQEEESETRLHLICNSDQPDDQISRMKAKVEAALFAIIQEAVNNALKHAVADNITVRLEQKGDQLAVAIVDDGVGFDVHSIAANYEDRGSYGMVNLRERVAVAHGDYFINSTPSEGTEIQVNVPLSAVLPEE